MQFSVTFRHLDATEAIKEYARDKVERIKKYFPDPIHAHVVLSCERGYQHMADVNIQLHNGLVLQGSESTEDMYSSIDLVMAKIERQCRRFKEKIRGHKARADLSSIPVRHTVFAAASEQSASDEPQVAEKKTQFIRTEQMSARSHTVDEALLQLSLLGQSFFVFRNSESGQVNVLYRREDGTFSLIETEGTGT
jgi:putative sigma-54 modulation protein